MAVWAGYNILFQTATFSPNKYASREGTCPSVEETQAGAGKEGATSGEPSSAAVDRKPEAARMAGGAFSLTVAGNLWRLCGQSWGFVRRGGSEKDALKIVKGIVSDLCNRGG
jgi:hypothetical protein